MEWRLTLARLADDEDAYYLVLELYGAEFLRFPISREQVYELAVHMLAATRAKPTVGPN